MKRCLMLLLYLVGMLLLAGCSGNQATENPSPTVTAVASLETKPTAISVPTATAVPEPVATAGPTPIPPAAIATAVPTPIPPAPTATAKPTATPVPPTATPVPPTPTPLVSYTVVDTFGFALTLDGEVTVENSGLSSDSVSVSDGVIFFEYSGANSILMWFEDTESEIDSVLSDTYTSFVGSQPDVTFLLLDEGDVTVDSNNGKYLSFSTTNSSGDSGGGIIGSWRCSSGKVFASTATGSDATVVQIRFKRLLDGFACQA